MALILREDVEGELSWREVRLEGKSVGRVGRDSNLTGSVEEDRESPSLLYHLGLESLLLVWSFGV